jgi:hypothetical protein
MRMILCHEPQASGVIHPSEYSHYPRRKILYFFYDSEEKLSLLDKLHKLVAMIFAVSFEIIIQRAVGNEKYL